MKIPENILKEFIEEVEFKINSYNRKKIKKNLSEKGDNYLEKTIKSLYGQDKKIEWLNNAIEVKNKLNLTDKPWVHHYSMNMSWILFFKTLYELVYYKTLTETTQELENFIEEGHETYHRVYKLYNIFNIVDGILESGDTIYLVKTDINFIKSDIKKIFI